PNRDPFALLTGGRCLPGRRGRIGALARDHRAAAAPAAGGRLFVCADTRTAALLRAGGRPTTLACLIRRGSRLDLDDLFGRFAESDADPDPVASRTVADEVARYDRLGREREAAAAATKASAAEDSPADDDPPTADPSP